MRLSLLFLVLLGMPAISYSFVSSVPRLHASKSPSTSGLGVAAPLEQHETEEERVREQKRQTRKLRKEREKEERNSPVGKLKFKLLKQLKNVAKDYDMLQDGDHIMVCVSGGKDSAALLVLLMHLQEQFKPIGVDFRLTAVHVDQKQPGYDGVPLVQWFDELGVDYEIIEEDTYSVVVDKTSEGKSYCTMCSRLRRGILYSKALELGCNKLVLGHHADDSLETLILNMLHVGQLKAMPARYTSKRGKLAVMRPLITCMEDDIEEYARLAGFPILPCNLCKNQNGLHRPQVKLLLSTLDSFTPDAKKNWLTSLSNVMPSHLLDQDLRKAVGMDPITGEEEDEMDENKAP
jgi:tRNA 2-thiocytidine biosynthesis protein TtcA